MNELDGAVIKERLAKLKKMQSLSLDQKINISVKILKKSIELGNFALLYSGGKDSTAILTLLDILGVDKKKTPIIYNKTTLESDEEVEKTRNYAISHGWNYIETLPDVTPKELWKTRGHFPIFSKIGFTKIKKLHPTSKISPVQCCYNLKEKPAEKVLRANKIKVVFWGNRAEESHRRQMHFCHFGFIFQAKKTKRFQSYPVQHWNRKDIIEFLKKNTNYDVENSYNTGCKICGTDFRRKGNRFTQMFLHDKKLWEYYMLECGFAEQIAIINNLKSDKESIKKIIKTRPELLLRFIKTVK